MLEMGIAWDEMMFYLHFHVFDQQNGPPAGSCATQILLELTFVRVQNEVQHFRSQSFTRRPAQACEGQGNRNRHVSHT